MAGNLFAGGSSNLFGSDPWCPSTGWLHPMVGHWAGSMVHEHLRTPLPPSNSDAQSQLQLIFQGLGGPLTFSGFAALLWPPKALARPLGHFLERPVPVAHQARPRPWWTRSSFTVSHASGAGLVEVALKSLNLLTCPKGTSSATLKTTDSDGHG